MPERLDMVRYCHHCGMAVKDADEAIYDEVYWFCDSRCHGQWIVKLHA